MPSSLGPMEILVILVVALIVLGPNKLPGAARQVGKTIAEVRKWSQGFQDEIRNVIDVDPVPSYPPPPAPAPPSVPTMPAEPAPPGSAAAGSVAAGNGHVPGPVQHHPAPPDPPGPPAGEPPRT
jgi:sec-independent protein translocase protein TatB